ncbi:MAG: hypothetical protein HKP52_02925 [Desulfofustis sp.]|nr:hypothetical protein [Desulfofustis sp.]
MAAVEVRPPAPDEEALRNEKLITWVLHHVDEWEQYRENNYEDLWKEYYRSWKQVWTESEKTRDSERSKFISPALQQAIEMAVAEAEESTFGRVKWIDIEDDLVDEMKADMILIRDQLIEDMELNHVPDSIVECYLNAAIYGTGIGKIITEEIEELQTDEAGYTDNVIYTGCFLEAISPEDFVIDPEARSVEEALGCAHIVVRPRHTIEKKQSQGLYAAVPLGDYSDDRDVSSKGEWKSTQDRDKVEIIEYHGFVPSNLLGEEEDEFKMTEAIVTIANRQSMLKAVENPFTHEDRSIVAFQWDKVPNRFWGRGIAEKGINSQRALNAELRARQDGLALTIHPMMAFDATRLPRGVKMQVAPGKSVPTNGNPREILNPMHFGEMSSHTYQQAGELERMLGMAVGVYDASSPVSQIRQNETLGGMSIIAAGSIKRSKRTMQNIERRFLTPLIRKFVWRYMQFDPQRYPSMDYKFLPRSSMGIMAREFTMAQISQAMQVVPPDQPVFGILLENFFNNSSLPEKEKIKAEVQRMYQPKQPDPAQQANIQLELEKLQAEIEKIKSEAVENYANADSKQKQAEVNAFNAVAMVEDNELDRNR